ncbi:TatD family hydrolase [Candidatus Dojkabacteria bacterium]|uniref:TatD family hydrolase n=1 Tax=Candidatus Dojkabacteria bacterium TaxID=2099670 RepID=A0A955IDP6_9BACT|nr:TatD family hydrolase [Candidatus Dojkabacteria bacterium]
MKNTKLLKYFEDKFGNVDSLFDTHTHLMGLSEDELEYAVKRAQNNGVNFIVDVAVDLVTSRNTLQKHKKYPEIIFPTVGIDPEVVVLGSDLYDESIDEKKVDQLLNELDSLVEENKDNVLMIGECGLDYYWIEKHDLSTEEKEKSKYLQKKLFVGQLQISSTYKLPLTMHHRDSLDKCLELINMSGLDLFGIFHSFTGNLSEAKIAIENGFAIGINGIVTYKSALELRACVQGVAGEINSPLDLYKNCVFLETDAPFLQPRGSKTKINEPANIKLIYDYLDNGQTE